MKTLILTTLLALTSLTALADSGDARRVKALELLLQDTKEELLIANDFLHVMNDVHQVPEDRQSPGLKAENELKIEGITRRYEAYFTNQAGRKAQLKALYEGEAETFENDTKY